MDIAIDRRPLSDGVELAVSGRLDAEGGGELRHAVAAEIGRGVPAISLDLAGVSFLSSAGIRVLFETQRDARAGGGDCLISAASEPVRKVLVLTRLDGILTRPASRGEAGPPLSAGDAGRGRDLDAAGVRLVGLEPAPAGPLAGRRHGTSAALAGGGRAGRVRLPASAFALGIAAFAAAERPEVVAGEMLAAAGAVYHRPPRPFAAVDYLLGSGDLVAEADVFTGLSWEGFPGGRADFEPAGDADAVTLDGLAAALLAVSGAEAIATVIVGDVRGLVAAELIRPLAEATAADHPLAGSRGIAARWLRFSREPIHAGRTALAVGVVARDRTGPLADMLAPLGPAGPLGHVHAVVFPHRPPRRLADGLAAVVADLAASEPLAVLHLVADDRPVLGGGVSELVRGACWFAPLAVRGGDA